MEDDVFKIKPVDTGFEVSENKQKTISPYNSVKNLKYAKLPALCNDCVYRAVEAGGNGKCPKYEKDAACIVREDFQKFLGDIDTRNPEDLKALLDMLAKMSMENVMLALFQSKMDGNIPDRNTKAEVNNLLNIVKIINELNSKITITEKKEYTKTGDISSIFRQIKAKNDTSN